MASVNANSDALDARRAAERGRVGEHVGLEQQRQPEQTIRSCSARSAMHEHAARSQRREPDPRRFETAT